MDLYRLIKDDNKRVNELFKQIAETSDRAGKTRQRLFERIREELEAQTEAKGKHFYRALARNADLNDVVSIARRDHRKIRAQLAEIATIPPYTRAFLDEVKALQKRVRLHLREEEQGVFPVVKRILDKAETKKIAERMQAFRERRHPELAATASTASATRRAARKATSKGARKTTAKAAAKTAGKTATARKAASKGAAPKQAGSKRRATGSKTSSAGVRAAAQRARTSRRGT
jgi:hypothetical protein